MATRTRIPLLRRMAYSVLATAVFFVLLECVLWGVAWFSASALQDSLPPPEDNEATIDNLGDADRALVCLGDSVTWGMPGPPGYSYPNRLGGMLRDTGTRVVNLGRPGWGMKVLAQALAQIVRNNTSAKSVSVLLLGGHNDCDYRSQRLDQGGSTQARQIVGTPSPFLQTSQTRFPLRDLLRNSRTYRLTTQVMVQLQDQRGLTEACGPSIREGLAQARMQASASDFGLAVATYPLPLRWARGDQAGPAAVSWSLNQLLRAEAGSLGLPLVDLAKCVQGRQAESSDEFFTEDDLHMTRHGHEATAQCLASSMDLLDWPGESSKP